MNSSFHTKNAIREIGGNTCKGLVNRRKT